MVKIMHDDLDRRLLRIWQDDPDLPLSELADRAGLSGARATRKIDRLIENGVVQGRRAVIDWSAMGYAVTVSLRVTLDKTAPRAFDDFIATARAVPEVIELQTFLGRVDVRLSVIARDMPHYQAIWRDTLLNLPHIADIEGLMTVATVKDDARLPL